MTAKPRKSVVQNIIKNLLEMEIPEIQTASKELAEWIKQLEQHSFKLQHYATEIESWASEEEEADSIELTDLIKDLEATLTDMRKSGTAGPLLGALEIEEPGEASDRGQRSSYGRTGRILKEPKMLPKAEIKESDERMPMKQSEHARAAEEPVKKETSRKAQVRKEPVRKEPARTPQGVLIAKDSEKTRVKAELPTSGKELDTREAARTHGESVEGPKGYLTPEGFVIRRLRP
ncbi:MAG: hypothetical protein ABSF74_08485 [Dehalococcoidia bacterium]|jgi:outer membrane biosynthesis protein TonB